MITSFRDNYEFLSNFYPCKITIAGYTFPSVENAYQAMKCANPNDYSQFVNIGPAEAKKLGRKIQIRNDWEQIKYNVMKQLLDLKFQDKVLLRMLLDTAPESIVEGNYWHDNYWGICQCDKCKDKIKHNHLGELLQRKRNLSGKSDIYTMYCGSIYHRESKIIIERPAFLYDEDGYVLLNIGNAEWCQQRLEQFINSPTPELFKGLKVFEFKPDISKYQICELMNKAMMCTGFIKNIIEDNI